MADGVELLRSQATAAFSAGQHAEARALFERLLRKRKDDLDALEYLGRIDLERGEFDGALKRFQRALRLRPDNVNYLYFMGQTYADMGRTHEAIKRFDQVIRQRPNAVAVIHAKALALERIGATDAAREIIDDALGTGVDVTPHMVASLARLDLQDQRIDEAIARLRDALAGMEMDDGARQLMLFTLGKACDKQGDYRAAFAACREANAIHAVPFDRAAYGRRIDDIIRVFSKATIAALPRPRRTSELPVFVVGMPRSGTTLVEQIIDAHPSGAGLGEPHWITEMAGDLQRRLDSYEAFPDCVPELDASHADRLAASYLNFIRGQAPRGATRAVNKALDNFEYLGLINILWPSARAIFSHRDPRDTCLSCFLNHILPTRYPFVTDLRNLGFVYRQHERLLAHWRDVCDLPILDLSYESLVDEPELRSREMIEFLGLTWDDRCLRFYDSGRTVMTLSYDQVSKPIYSASKERWRRYEPDLGPLLDELGED